MRDLAFLGFLAALIGMGLRRPFLLVLAYVYIDVVSPQRLTYFLLNAVPISLIAVGLAVGGWLLADDKRDSRFAPRQGLILLLLLYCWCTLQVADFPLEARDKWDWAWKSLAFAAFLPLTLRTRLRIEALLLFMLLSASSIIIVGGIKTLASGGGGYGELNLMVDNNSGLYESSTIATVSVAIVPLVLWFSRHGTIFAPDWRVRWFARALAFACLLIPVGTSARTGLLCIALVALLALREAKRKILYVSMLGVAVLVAVPLLPSSFTQRMGTIQNHQADESASTRLAVSWTLEYVRRYPFGGGFEAYRGNRIRYDIVKPAGPAAGTAAPGATAQASVSVDKGRAYHSAYFEMLGEQGWPGLILWLLINGIGVLRMEVLRRRYRTGPDAWAGALAVALQNGHLVYLLGAAFVGIAFQPFVYMLIGAQIGLDSYLARRRRAAAEAVRPRPDGRGRNDRMPRALPTG